MALKELILQIESLFDKFIEDSLATTALLMKNHPSVDFVPELSLLPNNFLFRNAVCFQVLLMEWVSKGNPFQSNEEKVINDIIDLSFVVYALYFNGILSKDKKLIDVYENVKPLLGALKSSFSGAIVLKFEHL